MLFARDLAVALATLAVALLAATGIVLNKGAERSQDARYGMAVAAFAMSPAYRSGLHITHVADR